MKIGDMVITPWGAGVIVAKDLPKDKSWRWGVCFTGHSVTRFDCWGVRHPPSAYFWNSEVAPLSKGPEKQGIDVEQERGRK